MRHRKYILGIIFVLLTITSCSNSVTKNNINPFVEWAKKNATEIETLELTEKQNDLDQLKQIIGNAEFVCLGENRHDIHEQFLLKHRFIKYLVEEIDTHG